MLLVLASACTNDLAAETKQPAKPAETKPPAKSVSATPAPTGHYCDPKALTAPEGKRLMQLAEAFDGLSHKTTELPTGYALTFSAKFHEVGEMVDLYRRCCPTIDIAVRFPARAGDVALQLTSTIPGAKEFIREEMGLKPEAP